MKKFIINSKQVRNNCVRIISHITKDDNMEVILQPHIDDQTNEQRSFWHVLVRIMAKDLGYTEPEMKHAIKCEHYGSENIEILGTMREVVRSTTENNKNEYSELIESTYRIASEQGIILPNAQYR